MVFRKKADIDKNHIFDVFSVLNIYSTSDMDKNETCSVTCIGQPQLLVVCLTVSKSDLPRKPAIDPQFKGQVRLSYDVAHIVLVDVPRYEFTLKTNFEKKKLTRTCDQRCRE